MKVRRERTRSSFVVEDEATSRVIPPEDHGTRCEFPAVAGTVVCDVCIPSGHLCDFCTESGEKWRMRRKETRGERERGRGARERERREREGERERKERERSEIERVGCSRESPETGEAQAESESSPP